MPPEPLQGKSIVVTGVTGQVAEPVAMALAQDNQVVGAARFKDQPARERLEAAGVRCVPIDLVSGDVGDLPADADYVINFAVAKTNDWELDLQANSGGLAWLMEHHQNAAAFVHCSTTGVYKPLGHHVFSEGSGRSCAPTASARSQPKAPPAGPHSGSGCPPPWPGCRFPTGTGGDGRPSTSR
jgi:nucleoside-diphosphate-sugar epimerase